MNKNKILNGLFCCAIAANLISCSSTKPQASADISASAIQQKSVVQKNEKAKAVKLAIVRSNQEKEKQRLETQRLEKQRLEAQRLEAQRLEKQRQEQEAIRVAQARQKAVARQQALKREQAVARHEWAKRQQMLKRQQLVKRRPVAKKPAKRIAKRRPTYYASRITPVKNVRYASLRGDYAGNSQAVAFINMMSSRHGFDRGYLNYLFSNTKLTPFLRRMAYADTYGRTHKKRRKSRPGRWSRYRGNFLTEKTISKGLQFWRANRVALQQAEDRYGVPQEYILGIIGVETRYGGNVGKNRAIDALAAMGFDNPRRGKYFQSELESYLIMARRAGLDPLRPMASYAGALGLCQFMPSNIKRYGVDFDGKGGINLWTAPDAIASVANYFSKHGWQRGGTVAVPAMATSRKYRAMKTGFKSKHSLRRLRDKGVVANNLGNISGKASLIKLNTYDGDELWIGGKNFYVITRYNHSSHYAMAVHQLAQAIKSRIGGRGVIRQAAIEVPRSLL